MGKKIAIITMSILAAFVVMSSGYSKWNKSLIVEGDITVVPIELNEHRSIAVNTTSSSVVAIDVTNEYYQKKTIENNKDE